MLSLERARHRCLGQSALITTTAFLAEYYYVMTPEVSFVLLLPSPHAPCRDLSVCYTCMMADHP